MREPLLTLAFALTLAASPALAAITPDPGGAGAWGAGLSLLADRAGPLLAFDQAAHQFAPGPEGARHIAWNLAASHARLFELDAFGRTRVAFGARAQNWCAAVGIESFGPVESRRVRFVAAGARRLSAFDCGAAWSEWRAPGGSRAGSLDLALATRAPRGVRAAIALRSLAAGGAPGARSDPDWTAEAAWGRAPSSVFLAVTRDLAGSRVGGGVALAAGPLVVSFGALGEPWSWSLALVAGGSLARTARVHAGYARIVHPSLGLSELWESGVTW